MAEFPLHAVTARRLAKRTPYNAKRRQDTIQTRFIKEVICHFLFLVKDYRMEWRQDYIEVATPIMVSV